LKEEDEEGVYSCLECDEENEEELRREKNNVKPKSVFLGEP